MEEKELNEIVIVEQLPIIKQKLQLISDEVTVKLLKQSGHIMMDTKEFMNMQEFFHIY